MDSAAIAVMDIEELAGSEPQIAGSAPEKLAPY
jgi:hypothetical protein